MDTNLIGLAIAVIGSIGGLIISLFSKISELKGRLDALASESRLQEQVDKIQNESIQKLQQWATELHDTTQTQLDQLAADIAQQQTQVHISLQVLKTQEASSVAVLTERAQQLVQQFQAIEQGVQQLRSTTEAESARLMVEIGQVMRALSQQETTLLDKVANQLQQVKQEIEQEVGALRQEKVSTRLASLEVQIRWLWWSQLDEQWQAIFKRAIGIESEPTENELMTILSLTALKCKDESERLTSLEPLRMLTGLQTLDCSYNQLTSLEPLRACTALQTLNCYENLLTSLEPLHGLKSLQILICNGYCLSQIEHFKKAVPSCEVSRY